MKSMRHYIDILRESTDMQIYASGRCHVFAMALSLVFGYAIQALWDLEPDYDDIDDGPEALVHAWCERPNGSLVDVSGDITWDQAKTEYGDCNIPDIRKMTIAEIGELEQTGILPASTATELKMLERFIKANQARYG
jgi:hypothetical protein